MKTSALGLRGVVSTHGIHQVLPGHYEASRKDLQHERKLAMAPAKSNVLLLRKKFLQRGYKQCRTVIPYFRKDRIALSLDTPLCLRGRGLIAYLRRLRKVKIKKYSKKVSKEYA